MWMTHSSVKWTSGQNGSVVPIIPFRTDRTDPMLIELFSDNDATQHIGAYSNNITSFFAVFPTKTHNSFQQGQKSNTSITYEVICDLTYNNWREIWNQKYNITIDESFA